MYLTFIQVSICNLHPSLFYNDGIRTSAKSHKHDKITELDAKMGELESPDRLNTRKTQLQTKMHTSKNKLTEYNVCYSFFIARIC